MMGSMLLNVAGGLFCVACLLAGLPVAATDLPEYEVLVDPEGPGSVMWQRQLGTSYYDQEIGVATDAAGNVLIGGRLDGRTVVAKYSPAGKRLSTRQLGSWSYNNVAWDAAGNFLIVSRVSLGLYEYEGFVAKYSAAGERLWTRQLVYGFPSDVATDAAGNVLIGGSTRAGSECCPSEAFAAKYSPAGRLLWTRTLGPSGVEINVDASGVATDTAGNVFIAGGTNGHDHAFALALLAKYNADGKLLWTRRFGSVEDYTWGAWRRTLPAMF
jgi:Beta-propeller repeat